MKAIGQAIALALLWSTVAGCAAAPGGEPKLAGTHWNLASADRGVLAQHASGSGVTLAFEAGRVSGYGGCNSYSGEYTLAGGELRIGPLTRTKRGCMGAAGEVEAAWHAALAGPLRLAQQSERLTLTAADGLVLRFEPGAAPARP